MRVVIRKAGEHDVVDRKVCSIKEACIQTGSGDLESGKSGWGVCPLPHN